MGHLRSVSLGLSALLVSFSLISCWFTPGTASECNYVGSSKENQLQDQDWRPLCNWFIHGFMVYYHNLSKCTELAQAMACNQLLRVEAPRILHTSSILASFLSLAGFISLRGKWNNTNTFLMYFTCRSRRTALKSKPIMIVICQYGYLKGGSGRILLL